MSNLTKADINWRNIGVKRERTHEPLIARLSIGVTSIFRNLKDLMIFAAMIGHSSDTHRALTGDTINIILDTYSSDHKDGFIYLLALLKTKDGVCLKDENLHNSVKYFEEYCNEGLYEITRWLDDNPGDPTGVETMLDHIYKKLGDSTDGNELDNKKIELDI